MSRDVFRGSQELKTTFGSLSVMGQAVVWPEVSQYWSHQAVGWCQVSVPKWWPSGAHADEYSMGPPLPVSLSHSELQLMPASTGDPQSQVGLAQTPMESLLWSGSSVHEPSCKSGVFVSSSPMELLYPSPAGLQSQMLWGFLLPIPDPQTGKPDMRLRTLIRVGEPL